MREMRAAERESEESVDSEEFQPGMFIEVLNEVIAAESTGVAAVCTSTGTCDAAVVEDTRTLWCASVDTIVCPCSRYKPMQCALF